MKASAHIVPLSVNYFDNDKILALENIEAEAVYLRLCCLAKRLDTNGKLTRLQVETCSRGVSDMNKVMKLLVEAELVTNTKGGISINAWSKWNNDIIVGQDEEKSKAGKIGNHIRWHRTEPAADCEWCQAPQEKQTEKDKKKDSFESEFDEVWKFYPHKVERIASFKAYQARRRQGITYQELLQATQHFALSMTDREQKYIMRGKTFYGPNERWKDYLEGVRQEKSTVASLREIIQKALGNE